MGGAIGSLSRTLGLTIDDLLGIDMVLADGSSVTASAKAGADLIWAVRGGGGNFGVTSLGTDRIQATACRERVSKRGKRATTVVMKRYTAKGKSVPHCFNSD